MHDKINTSVLQTTLEAACKGTSVTTRELIKELTIDDIADIKSGDLTTADLVNIVLDMADDKDNAKLYRVKVKSNESDSSPDNVF